MGKCKASNLTIASLLLWISDLHTELTNAGLLPGDDAGISDETHQQIVILAMAAEEKPLRIPQAANRRAVAKGGTPTTRRSHSRVSPSKAD